MRECKENDRRNNNTAGWDILNGNRWMALRAVMGYSHYAGEGRENTLLPKERKKRNAKDERRREGEGEKEKGEKENPEKRSTDNGKEARGREKK